MSLTTYDTSIQLSSITPVVSKIESATHSVNRELVIAACLLYSLWLSDPTITQDPDRLASAIESMSQHLALVVSFPDMPEPKDMN